jgi:hypothetical protein
MRGAKEAVKNKALESPPGPAVLPPSPGYPLPGCSSAEPDSVSPDLFTLSARRLQNQKSSKSIDQRRVRCRPIHTVRGRKLSLGFLMDLPARRLARTTKHELCRSRLSGIV